MNNTRIGVIIGSGVVAGLAFVYARKRQQRKRSVLGRTLHKASNFIDAATKLYGVASAFIDNGKDEADRQKKGVVEAINAGKHAYQRVAG